MTSQTENKYSFASLKKQARNTLFVVAGGALLVSFQNCGNVNIAPAGDYSSYGATAVNVDICSGKKETIKSNAKFIFVMDRSGSNQVQYTSDVPPVALPGTDPTGVRRFKAIEDFLLGVTQQDIQSLNLTAESPSRFWAMVNFSTSAYSLYGDTSPFSNEICKSSNILCLQTGGCSCDPGSFYAQVANQYAQVAANDGGWTSYTSSLSKAQAIIQADIVANKASGNPVSTSYRIVFVSDGAPYVQSGNTAVLEDSNVVLSYVNAIMKLKTDNNAIVDSISMSTAYYYAGVTPDAQAVTYLQSMATAGLGKFFSFSDGQPIDISKLATVLTRQQTYDLKEIWFSNINTVWWGDKLLYDTTGVGLPDSIKQPMGADPNLRDSDGNGVSDAVEYRVYGTPCGDPACKASGARNFFDTGGACNGMARTQDGDSDGLTDCEEKLLGSNLISFNSNGDYLPDPLAFKLGLPLTGGSELYLNPANDGLNNYQKIKMNLPLFANVNSMTGLNEVTYSKQVLSQDSTQTCYTYAISNLTMITDHDTIRVYAVENSDLLTDKPRMRVAEKKAVGGSISIVDDDFK